tara:strand:+ start:958 stop:2067 length:1110 start_codon:yes stop_codon:yes gene_type:complete
MAKKTKGKKSKNKDNKTKKNNKEKKAATPPGEAAAAPENSEFSGDKQYMQLGDAMAYSARTLPLAGVQFVATNYMKAVNTVAKNYLAGIGVSAKTQNMSSFNKEVKEAVGLFKTYIKVVAKTTAEVSKEALKTGTMLAKDKELMKRLDVFMKAAEEVTKIHLKNLLRLADQQLPLIKKQADKYTEVFQNTGTNAGKAGINAGLNAMQAVPGLGQALSIIRMIHAVTMPFFTFQRKMSNLAVKTANDMITIAEKNQPPAVLGLDKTLTLIKKALDAQDAAARKVVNFTNNTKAKLEGTGAKLGKIAEDASKKLAEKAADVTNKVAKLEKKQALKKGGYRSKRRRRRTKKRSLKKRHRRRTRRKLKRRRRR